MSLLARIPSLRWKLAFLVTVVAAVASALTWLGLRQYLGPTRTFPLVAIASVALTLLLERGITSPLREMTRATRAMAAGDYTQRVSVTGHDEVGQLGTAFNQMAGDLSSVDQARRDLIANVSHELRTPIAALQAGLENLVDGVVEPTPANLEQSLSQTERLTRLVNYLLDLSRVEAGASALNYSAVQIGDFLEEVANDLSMVEAVKDLRYLVDVTPADLVLRADPERLRQIIVNLVQNAIRHSPQAGEIRLRAYELPGQRPAVIIEVSDDGPGIAPDDRQRVFERFNRGSAITAGGTGGTGIGLSIVRWAAALHDGTVEVVDAPDGGATIRLTFPT